MVILVIKSLFSYSSFRELQSVTVCIRLDPEGEDAASHSHI